MPDRKSSKDIFPNVFKARIVQAALNDTSVARIPMPRPQLTVAKGKVWVYEILWVEYFFDFLTVPAQDASWIAGLSTTGAETIALFASLPLFFTDSGTFSYVELRDDFNTNVGHELFKLPFKHNLQSKDGYGFLVAADNVNFFVKTTSQVSVEAASCWVYYRLVQVQLEEYIGILASQQLLGN